MENNFNYPRKICMIKIGFLNLLFLLLLFTFQSCTNKNHQPDSNINGVQIGVITYSWRSMPGSAENILNYCLESGISSIELMGDVVEKYAGIPELPPKPDRNAALNEEEHTALQNKAEEIRNKRREWRLNVSMDKYRELRKMFNDAGISIHIVKFAPANWSDDEIDYAFRAARTLGADGVSNEIGHEACKRLGKFAEKHDMYAIFHNHLQPGDPDFSFEEFLAYSPNNMLNFDVGHYFGATNKHPNEVISRLHERIYSVHLKDKTGKFSDPPNANMPWGEGETPLTDILHLIRDEKWPIKCDIELEYDIPVGSDAVEETVKCLDYCKKILL